MQKGKFCGYKNTADSRYSTVVQDTESHSCCCRKLQFFMNWQFFKLEGMVCTLHTALDFASAIPTVEDLQN